MNLRFRLLVLTCVIISSCDYDITDIYRPEIKLIHPTENSVLDATYSQNFPIIFSASDDAGLDKYEIIFDDEGFETVIENKLGQKEVIEDLKIWIDYVDININHFSSSTYIRDYQYSRKFELVVYDVNGNFLSKTVKFIVECSRCWESIY